MATEGMKDWLRSRREQKGAHVVERATHTSDSEESSFYSWVDGPVEVGFYTDGLRATGLSASRFEGPKAFREAYPALYATLHEDNEGIQENKKQSRVPTGFISVYTSNAGKKYIQPNKSVGDAGLQMMADVKKALVKLANEVQKGKTPIAKADYFIGQSRLATAAHHFGFDVFRLEKPMEASLPHEISLSHEWAQEAYEESGVDLKKAQRIASRRPSALAVISRQKLIELYAGK